MAFKLEYICGRNYNPLPEEKDIKFMQRCIELASKAKAHVHSNPMVGCVVVCGGEIIGEGYHKKFGTAHAEVEAIASVKDKSKLTSSTLYVNLEPCAHHGKTPPCADLIIQHKIPYVVISNRDPHEKVAGKGIQKLIDAGVKVTENVASDEGASLNRSFFTYHIKKRPYVILKWAETADGFMGRTSDTTNQDNAISNDLANRYVHQLRAESGAIFVGTNTAIVDNPSLTTRLVSGRNPLRVLLDIEGKIPESHRVYQDGLPNLVLGKSRNVANTDFIETSAQDDIFKKLSEVLYAKNMQQVLIEGGAHILNQCITRDFWDEIHVIQAPQTWNKGVQAPSLNGIKAFGHLALGDNIINIYRRD